MNPKLLKTFVILPSQLSSNETSLLSLSRESLQKTLFVRIIRRLGLSQHLRLMKVILQNCYTLVS